MKQKLRKILPHVAIVLSNMYIVFFLIDRVNTAMQFINNDITKALLLILSVISTVNASFLILDERRKRVALNRRLQAARAAQRSASAGQQGASAGARAAASAQRTASAQRSAPANPRAARSGVRAR